MNVSTVVNVVRNAMNTAYFPGIAHKVKLRLLNQVEDPHARARSSAWCADVVEDTVAFAAGLDATLWHEAITFADELAKRSGALGNFRESLGGGGHYPLLYFLTRRLEPAVVVETGVAAGFSSAAFLAGMAKNGRGHLYSSDFPAFRLSRPEEHVGTLVAPDLRPRWTLSLRGDRRNLPAILETAGPVNLFHYDSDKTYSGREFAMNAIAPHLAAGAVVVMDDIQDNLFFRDYVTRRTGPFRVFAFEGKYVGVVGI